METQERQSKDFIRQRIEEDLKTGKYDGRVHTRFPPEPNGYLHIGHAKAIVLNFEIAKEYGGKCNLRFDDTNPTKESMEFVEAIQEDVRWLGYDWEDRLYFTSDYFEQLYQWACELIRRGKAYVCDLPQEEFNEKYRGTTMVEGKPCPYRDRSVEENLELFERMRQGEFEEGEKVLRAKIDMSHPNILMRDPVIYRILKVPHFRSGEKWCIYPMYDFSHPLSDSIERITHSLCTSEFEYHRPLYDWFLEQLELYHPQQIEFSRLNLAYTVMSKRKLQALVREGLVRGWDDPRLPTLRGMHRRGYTPTAIRNFCQKVGISKRENIISPALLEHCVREDLNEWAPRRMAVLRPLKVVLTNYEKEEEWLEAENIPGKPEKGTRKVPFSKVLYIEQEDFLEEPPKKFFRLAPGRTVKLRYAHYITCEEVVKNDKGEIVELRCTCSPELPPGVSKKKAKSILHWVSAQHAITAEVRLYERLFLVENPDEAEDYHQVLNPHSCEVLSECYLEPSLTEAKVGDHFQFERLGYFVVDPDSSPSRLVFNRTVTLKDSWAKLKEKGS